MSVAELILAAREADGAYNSGDSDLDTAMVRLNEAIQVWAGVSEDDIIEAHGEPA